MSIAEAKPKRKNRTVTLHLGNTPAEYETTYLTDEGIQALIRQVEIADSLNWGCLATGHNADCPRLLRFTHHDSYIRWAKHFNGTKSPVAILRVRCLDCGAVFSVQPSFIIRYKRYDTDATEKLMTLLFITEDSYRMAGVSQGLGMDTQQAGNLECPGAITGHPAQSLVGTGPVVWTTLPGSIEPGFRRRASSVHSGR